MSNTNQQLFGRLAIELGYLTRDQLSHAIKLQEQAGHQVRLGELLSQLGWLTAQQLESIVARQRELEQEEVTPPPAPRTPPRDAAPTAPSTVDKGVDGLLRQAQMMGASDVHLHTGEPVRLRFFGELSEGSGPPLSEAQIQAWVQELVNESQLRALDESGQCDFSYAIPGCARFRANVYRQRRGLDLVFRIFPEKPPQLSELGLPQELARHVNHPQGLVLITGPMGCGKSTTLAALINLINEERHDHIITAEDPIEYVHKAQRCLVNQRQVGRDSVSYSQVLRAALREDPDVIAIGDLRDTETVSLALSAAETGHLVLGTLHTSSAVRTVHRVVGSVPPARQEQVRAMLSESLRVVISQRLVRRADGGGRVPACEILVVNRAVSNLIKENKLHQIPTLMQTGSAEGMCLMSAALDRLQRSGVITAEEVAASSPA